MIGQAFADEIFRVFRTHHSDTSIEAVNASAQVRRMIQHVS